MTTHCLKFSVRIRGAALQSIMVEGWLVGVADLVLGVAAEYLNVGFLYFGELLAFEICEHG